METSNATREECFSCEGSGVAILYLYVESMVHSNLAMMGLADVTGWIMTHCPYCRHETYWNRKTHS